MQARIEITSSADDVWAPWPVNWTAVWVGALAALAAAFIFSLIETAAGAQAMKNVVSWKTISIATIAATICRAGDPPRGDRVARCAAAPLRGFNRRRWRHFFTTRSRTGIAGRDPQHRPRSADVAVGRPHRLGDRRLDGER